MTFGLGRAIKACLLIGSAVALSACGGSTSSSSSPNRYGGPKVVDIYASLPLDGPDATEGVAILDGIKIALAQAHGRAGDFKVLFTPLYDATADGKAWNPIKTAANARRAATDPDAVYYIGEFSSDASEVSIPILNEARIAQVSPAATYVGLTTNGPGTVAGQPNYYPTGTRTFLRIIPNDSVQAAADLLAMKEAGCRRVALVNDEEEVGLSIASLLEHEKSQYGVDIIGDAGLDPGAPDYRAYANEIRTEGADCLMLAVASTAAAVRITEDVHDAIPSARIFGADTICNSRWTNSNDGGVPVVIDPLISCTLPTLKLDAYPGGKQFLAWYRAAYGVANPNPYAIYGYEAMKLGLDTIAGLGTRGDDKSAVLAALFAITDRHSVLGDYGFDRDGDTTLTSYGLYQVGPDGDPLFDKTLAPADAP